MSLWIPLDVDFHDHPKTQKLCRLLRISTADAYVTRVWAWCAKFYQNGRPDLDLLEERARWKGKPGSLVEGLRACGFLDPDGSLHNWPGRAGAALEKIEAKRKADRERKASKHSDSFPTEVARKSRGTPPEVAPQTEKEKEKEKESKEKDTPPPDRQFDPEAIERIFAHYLKTWPPKQRCQLSVLRRDLIAQRLREFTEQELREAISNSKRDTWTGRAGSCSLERHLIDTYEQTEKWLNFEPDRNESQRGDDHAPESYCDDFDDDEEDHARG